MTAPNAPLAAVYFDCDSTLASIEGVDELLQFVDEALRRLVRSMRILEGEI